MPQSHKAGVTECSGGRA